MEPAQRQQRRAEGDVDTVVFNVGGRHFEVLHQTIQAHPSTLLASLVEDIGTDAGQPIFVDANPERFGHILDWYRLGEMHVPRGCPVGGILRDARFFLLPDFVRINGSSHQVCPEPGNDAFDAGIARVVDHWPGFVKYVSGIIGELRKDIGAAGQKATRVQDDVLYCGSVAAVNNMVLPRKRVVLTKWCESRKRNVWADENNVCNRLRLAVLLSELAKRGLSCDITAGSEQYSPGSPANRPRTQLELFVGPQSGASGWPGAAGDVVRVQLAGVDTAGGRPRSDTGNGLSCERHAV